MTATTTGQFLDEPLLEWIDLPYVDRILDPAGLARTVGRSARLHRLRVKPGRSLLAGWQDDTTRESAAPGPEAFGWIAVMADPDKISNARQQAMRAGLDVTVHAGGTSRDSSTESSGDPTVTLLSGAVASDPGLARELAHARRRLPAHAGVEVLAYNPGRRLVLEVELLRGGDARQVVRVGAEPQDHLVGLARQWRGYGVPTLPVRRVGRRGTAVVSPRWGSGDLSRLPDPAAAELAGRTIGHLHAASAAPRRAGTSSVVPRGTDTIAALVPALAGRLTELAAGLVATLGDQRITSVVHGDLSPDQVLWDGEHDIRIIDLDRARRGAPESDVGSWLAACMLAGQPDLAVAFAAGHRAVPGLPTASREVRAAWCARALLASALEPFRRVAPDWRQHVTARVVLAEDVLSGRGGLP